MAAAMDADISTVSVLCRRKTAAVDAPWSAGVAPARIAPDVALAV